MTTVTGSENSYNLDIKVCLQKAFIEKFALNKPNSRVEKQHQKL